MAEHCSTHGTNKQAYNILVEKPEREETTLDTYA
jgi:hypothetical protein